jgi:hypothetical protein
MEELRSIFDDNQDVSLNVEYIIITDGGLLQIGMFIFLHFSSPRI